MTKKTWILVLLVIITGIIFPTMAAVNDTILSFSDLGLVEHSNLEIYGYNATSTEWEMQGLYNTSSTNLVFSPGSYQVVVRPSAISRLSNPKLMFTDAMAFVETYWLPMFLICALVVFAVRKW